MRTVYSLTAKVVECSKTTKTPLRCNMDILHYLVMGSVLNEAGRNSTQLLQQADYTMSGS